MSCHLLLNLLHWLEKMILCSAETRIISCLPTHVINLVINDKCVQQTRRVSGGGGKTFAHESDFWPQRWGQYVKRLMHLCYDQPDH